MEGGSLSEAVKRYQFEERHVAYVAREVQEFFFHILQVLKAIDYLHSLDLVHRDLKSGNIMLSTKGDVKLSIYLFED